MSRGFEKNAAGEWVPFDDDFARALADVERKPSGWQPIESAPKDGTRILVTDGEECATVESCYGHWVLSPTVWEGDERGGLAVPYFNPTHWQALPSLPGAAGELSPSLDRALQDELDHPPEEIVRSAPLGEAE